MFINDLIIYELQTSLDKRLNNLGQQGEQLDKLIHTHHSNLQNQMIMGQNQLPSQLPLINNKIKVNKNRKMIKHLNKIRDFLLDTNQPLSE